MPWAPGARRSRSGLMPRLSKRGCVRCASLHHNGRLAPALGGALDTERARELMHALASPIGGPEVDGEVLRANLRPRLDRLPRGGNARVEGVHRADLDPLSFGLGTNGGYGRGERLGA